MPYGFMNLDKATRDAYIALRNNLNSRPNGTAYATSDLDNLRHAVLDCLHLLLDEPQITAEDREYSLKVDPNDVSDQNLVPSISYYPHPSPDGTRIAYSKSDRSMWVAAPDGTGETPVGQTGGPLDWSPDGTQLVFADSRDGTGVLAIYTCNIDGTNLSANLATGTEPRWSQSGNKIAYQSNQSGTVQIWTMNPDGIGKFQVTHSPYDVNYPTWSPDSAKIAYYRPENIGYGIHAINADGTGDVNLTAGNTATNVEPSWSPNGRRIAFASNRDGNYEIYFMNADGTEPTRLTNNPGDDRNPIYNYDGSRLICSSTRSGVRRFYDMSADGVPVVPEYRHEYLMSQYLDYFAAWAYEHSPGYAATAAASEWSMRSVARGKRDFTYRENNADIVSRSLLRHGLRVPAAGEPEPPPIVGSEAPGATFSQSQFRGRQDDGSETTASWFAAVNTNFSYPRDVNLRVRFELDNSSSAVQADTLTLFYSIDGGAWAPVSAAAAVRPVTVRVADGTPTTQQLSSGAFGAGVVSSHGYAPSVSLPASTATELEFGILLSSLVLASGSTVRLQLRRGPASGPNYTLGKYVQTPTITAI